MTKKELLDVLTKFTSPDETVISFYNEDYEEINLVCIDEINSINLAITDKEKSLSSEIKFVLCV